MGLRFARAALVGLIGLILAAAAGRIFDDTVPALFAAPAIATVVGLLTLTRSWYVRLAAGVVGVLVAVSVIVLLAGGSLPGDAVDAFVDGLRRMLSTEWPSPERAEIVGAVGAALALSTALAVELCGRRRWHLAVLLPALVTYVGIVAASAPAGPATWWLLPLGAVAVGVGVLRPPGDLGDRLRILAGERRVATLSLVAVGLAVAVSVPVAIDERANPRRDEVASAVAPVVDPIESVVTLRELDPSQVRFEVTVTDGDASPTRWRTATLDVYDGERWTTNATVGPIGRRLGPDLPGSVSYEAELRVATDEIPLPGPPVLTDATVQTDPARTVVRLLEPGEPGSVVRMETGLDPTRAVVEGGQLATRPVDEVAAGLTSTAEALAGDGTIVEQLQRIETTLREEFALDPSAPGAGVQLALVVRFLDETRRGTQEQFVTSFVLLARSLGVNARVATGFVLDEVPARGEPLELSTADVAAWAEVEVVGEGWVAFDPVPPEAAPDQSDQTAQPREVAPAAPQPPLAPPANTEIAEEDEDEDVVDASDDGLPVAVVVALVAGLAVVVVAVPVLLVVAVIVLVKQSRRRRRLRATARTDRVRGAWAEATDALVDAGLDIESSWTDHDIASAGVSVAEGARTDLARLGAMSSAATFGNEELDPSSVDDAVARLEQVEATIAGSRSRWQRLRWRLSTRSLRRRTRSPVLGDRR